MTAAELVAAVVSGVAGAKGLDYGVKRLLGSKDQSVAELEKRLSKIEARSTQNREDIRRLLDRVPPPDLSERVRRLEDDMRSAATGVAEQNREVLLILGEVRGALDALKDGGE